MEVPALPMQLRQQSPEAALRSPPEDHDVVCRLVQLQLAALQNGVCRQQSTLQLRPARQEALQPSFCVNVTAAQVFLGDTAAKLAALLQFNCCSQQWI